MDKKQLHKILSVFTAVILLLPVGLQLAHTLEHHEHTVCDSKELQHIHKQELDCSIYHVKLISESFDLESGFTFFIPVSHSDSPIFLANNCDYNLTNYKPTRGPPLFII